MKKIIHLSDLHIGYPDLVDRFRCIVQTIIFLKEPGTDYVVVITGDLVNKATAPSNYEEARLCIDRLTEKGFTVLVVPGNHDYGTGNLGAKKYVNRFKEMFFGTTGVEYPKLDIIDGTAFIGLDSMAAELHWHDRIFAEGELGRDQLDRLDALLQTPPVTGCTYRVVYLHHHPFDPRPLHHLVDSRELGEVLLARGPIDALLYGHNHEGKIRHGKWNIPRCFDAGTTTLKDNRPGFHRVIDLSLPPGEFYDGNFHCP